MSLIKINKIALSTGDDMGIQTFNCITTSAYGKSNKIIPKKRK